MTALPDPAPSHADRSLAFRLAERASELYVARLMLRQIAYGAGGHSVIRAFETHGAAVSARRIPA